jgi:hypothetical protein
MRQKAPKESTVNKYINFLLSVHDYSIGNFENGSNLRLLAANCYINKNVAKAIVELKIVDIDGKGWHWLSFKPDRTLALTVLDYLLVKNKKQVHTPLAGMEAFTTAIRQHTEAIQRNSLEINSGLRTLKNRSNDNTPDLFKIDSERLFLAGAIASGIYHGDFFNSLSQQHISQANDYIVEAVDDLLTKLKAK